MRQDKTAPISTYLFEEMDPEQARREVEPETIPRETWEEMFEGVAHGKAYRMVLPDTAIATKRINMGYLWLREDLIRFRGIVDLRRNGNVVYVLPEQSPPNEGGKGKAKKK